MFNFGINMKSHSLKQTIPKNVNQAVPLIYASGPDAFEYVFKNDQVSAQDFLKHAFVKKGGEFSFDNHYALFDGEELVGIGAVFNKQKAASFTFKDALNIIGFYGFGFFARAINGLKVETMIKLPKKNEITLGHLGIKPALRGKGYGTILIKELMKVANPQKDDYFVLDVSEENPKAKALYERLGFNVTKKYTSNLKNKYSYVPNHFRMELKNDRKI